MRNGVKFPPQAVPAASIVVVTAFRTPDHSCTIALQIVVQQPCQLLYVALPTAEQQPC
jgi:hypothetical protein